MSFWTFVLILMLVAFIVVLLTKPAAGGIAVDASIAVGSRIAKLLASWFRKSQPCFLAACLAITLIGCDSVGKQVAYPLPKPPPESPVCNLPKELHQRNKLGPLGQGSCVHASLVNHLRWLNRSEFAERWWATYGDGEYASRLMQRLDATELRDRYWYTEKADPRFLDWCTVNRTGAILWWKPSHCCTFEGFSMGEHIRQFDPTANVQNGVQYACILDNNYPGKFEYTERTRFIRLWASYGGFALCVLDDPATSIPYLSYELR